MNGNKFYRAVLSIILFVVICFSVTSCAELDSYMQSVQGSLIGAEYNIEFFDNNGGLFLTAHGNNISMNADTDVDGNMSSVVNITIDGNQMVSCGSTAIFADTRLKPDAEFSMSDINSNGDGVAIVDTLLNSYKNAFGKPMVLVIQSQLGVPICAYSSNKVYWEVCDDLPKTTKLMVDGKAIYVHRANFQIIDLALLN